MATVMMMMTVWCGIELGAAVVVVVVVVDGVVAAAVSCGGWVPFELQWLLLLWLRLGSLRTSWNQSARLLALALATLLS